MGQPLISALSILSVCSCLTLAKQLLVVTGANGVLGRSLVAQSLVHRYDAMMSRTVVAAYRSESRMKQAIESEMTASSTVGRGIADGLAIPDIVNMRDANTLRRFVDENIAQRAMLMKQVILFNNAGVCIEGTSHSALEDSLLVNCLGPARLTELTINSIKHSPLERSGDDRSLTIINVSSGEGELLFLNSRVQDELRSIKTYEVSGCPLAQLSYPDLFD
jgi:NAD(P)-dependent dehydrogenase (short-subunit alcohol dehydrogenase family)